jgi:F0F1-type ATP synthase delta subunit
MRDRYITATLELLREHHKVGEVVSGLRDVLVARNHERLLGVILRGVLRRLEDGASGATPKVVIAKEEDVKKQKSVIEAMLAELGAKDEPQVTVDPTLIGGVVVSNNYQRIDTSYKRALQSLYERVTK